MKRFFSLFCVALLSVALPVVSADDAGAQGQIYVTDAASAAASDVINGRVVSTISVEVDGEMHRATEIEISSAPKGRLSGSVLVETPGGERADGTVMFVSHTPELIPNELVQLALMPAEHHTSAVLPVATGRDLPVYSVAGGSDGAWGLLPDGVGRANAVGDYSLTGSSWPDFAPPVPFNVNYRNSGISESATIEAVKQGFQIWEDDPGSTVEFSYSGETTKVGVNLEDNVNTVSWVTPPAGTGWLAQANWMATTNGEILGFDIRVSRNYNWSNGAASGRYDIATVVAHEVGHGIGLGHGPSSSDLMHALIQQGSAKGLGAGDRSGAAFLYPSRDPICNGVLATVDLSAGGVPTEGRDVIMGTSDDDVIDGLGGDDLICGGGGSDRIVGGGGNDVIEGGDGDDKLFGGPGNDVIRGGTGNDTIHGNLGPDLLYGDAGNDKIFGYADADTIYGGTGNDYLHGNRGADRIFGGPGHDRLWGYAHNDILAGEDGNDLIVGNYGDDHLEGGDGDDLLKGVGGNDVLLGGPANDELIGNDGDDTLDGGDGNDTLDGGVDFDSCDGGTGSDSTSRCETVT